MKRSLNGTTLVVLGCFLFTPFLAAQEKINAEFNPDAWKIEAQNSEFTEYKGKQCLYLENGSARLTGSSFKTGIIDYDVSFDQGRKFAGIHFRIQDPVNYEEFYLRAHQSGNPDAMQYTPVYNGVAGWQLYYGAGHSTPFRHNFGEWIHIRLIVTEKRMDVFIGDMSKPILHVNDLKRDPMEGMLGFGTLMGGAYFANLVVQPMSEPSLVSKPEPLPGLESGTIATWQVSTVLGAEEISSVNELKDLPGLSSLGWSTLQAEHTGTVNLASVSPWSREKNTVLAKAVIHSGKDQLKRLDFGYSDIARVYVNGKVIYSGQRIFRSRDYRYLGTIGYFDAVYLDLKRGENEVVFAITETFGGWGLRARLENLNGIEL